MLVMKLVIHEHPDASPTWTGGRPCRLRAGRRGAATISTTDDDDTDAETFTVALGTLPAAVTAGKPVLGGTSRSADDDVETALSASAETVVEGSEVTITATASQAVAANTEVELMRDADSTASLEDYKLATPRITIMMGDTNGTLTLTATDDDNVEGDESLTLNGTAAGRPAGRFGDADDHRQRHAHLHAVRPRGPEHRRGPVGGADGDGEFRDAG